MIPLRDENPTQITPYVTIALITVNALVFLFQQSLAPDALTTFVYNYGVVPAELQTGQNLDISPAISPYLSLLTAMFLHGSWMHLGAPCPTPPRA